jgi:diadenosine tetraphosphate (Ap4A) HIT family hydrolase
MNVMNPNTALDCTLCGPLQGVLIVEHASLRVIRAESAAEADYPAFYRVVWRAHVRELSDLSAGDLALCMRAVVAVERSLREQLSPAPLKINIASLGNLVPHLHWHIIARYAWDAHWPKPVWAVAERAADAATLAAMKAQLPKAEAAMREAMARDLGDNR